MAIGLTVGVLATAFGVGAGVSTWLGRAREARRNAVAHANVAPHAGPISYYDLLALEGGELEKCDIGLMNLLCAKDLPGAEDLDIPATLKKLDEWAAKVKSETGRHLYRVKDPRYAEHYTHSEARLRAELMIQVLQEDCGVRYNPQRIRDVDFSNSRDLFIHGIAASDNGGTCASMPVLYVAIARRLGYPMKLVAAKEHLFCRWDDGKERFNIEASGDGVSYPPDDHYRAWPHPISEGEVASGEYLASMTATGELAAFVFNRACCCQHNGRLPEARAAFAEAHRLEPQSRSALTALRLAVGGGFSRPHPLGLMESEADGHLRAPALPDPTPRAPTAAGLPTQPPPGQDRP